MYYINASLTFAAVARQVERWKCLFYSSVVGGTEPKVWYLKDRDGIPYWLVCLPDGDRPIAARNEGEVRQILGRQYRDRL